MHRVVFSGKTVIFVHFLWWTARKLCNHLISKREKKCGGGGGGQRLFVPPNRSFNEHNIPEYVFPFWNLYYEETSIPWHLYCSWRGVVRIKRKFLYFVFQEEVPVMSTLSYDFLRLLVVLAGKTFNTFIVIYYAKEEVY